MDAHCVQVIQCENAYWSCGIIQVPGVSGCPADPMSLTQNSDIAATANMLVHSLLQNMGFLYPSPSGLYGSPDRFLLSAPKVSDMLSHNRI